MRAKESLVQLGLAGLGKFVVMTSAFCLAMTVAITGPPTPSETAGVSAVVTRAVRRFDTTALNFNLDLCRRAAVIAHAAGLCAAPVTVVVRKDAPQPVEVAAVSQTLPLSAREILPPDTLDQIQHPSRRPEVLLGSVPPTPRHAATATHPPRAVAHAHASPPHNRALASSHGRTQHAAAHVRRAPTTRAARAASRTHAARPSRHAPATPVRAIVRPAPRAARPVAAPAAEQLRPHQASRLATTLDEQLEHIAAPPNADAREPAHEDEPQPPAEKS
ncbi:MAG: hypothetical protein WAU68_17240 [Vitreimonas sp.]